MLALACVATPASWSAAGEPRALDAVRKIATHSIMEGHVGNIAELRARHAAVRRLARRMVESHGRMLEELEHLAAGRNVILSVSLGAEQNASVRRLAGVPLEEFDRAYLRWLVRDHRAAAITLRAAARAGDAELADFSRRTLPVLAEHVRLARRVLSELEAGPA